MSQHRTPPMTSPNDAADTWDDDFEFQSSHSSRNSKTKNQTSTSSSALPPPPSEEESWDDAYEDDDMVRRESRKLETAEEMGSWGSGSDWSGDGDAEDLSHDSYTEVTSEHRRSSSSAPQPSHTTRTPGLLNSPDPPPFPATPAFTDTPSAPSSFFSKISPVKKWKARDTDVVSKASGTAHTKPKKNGLESKSRKQVQKLTSTVVLKHDSKNTTDSQPKEPTELKRMVSGATHPVVLGPSWHSSHPETKSFIIACSQPASPLTPDLQFSPVSTTSYLPRSSQPLSSADPASTVKAGLPFVSLHVPRPKRHARPSTAIPSLSPAPSLPLLSSSAHNLPSSAPPTDTSILTLTPRRSSLSDLKRPQLKIPERISRVQHHIKRDMGDVKEFADCVAQLKDLQHIYAILLRDLRAALTDTEPPTTPVSSVITLNSPASSPRARRPSFSPKKRRDTLATTSPQPSPTKPTKRKFSLAATPPQIPRRYATALDRLDTKYSVWWECAELLAKLGGRNPGGGAYAEGDLDWSDEDASLGLGIAAGMTRGRRARAVTLDTDNLGSTARARSTSTGPPLASPVRSAQRRATTGRAGGRDLTPRQLALLRGMLETDARIGWDPHTAGVERVREEADGHGSGRGKEKGGGRGIRDLWRGLRKGTSVGGCGSRSGGAAEGLMSRGSSSCDSSTSETYPAVSKLPGSFGSKTSKMPSSSKQTVTASDAAVLSRRKQPTRRPSLAGIFGLGQKVVRADVDADETGANAMLDASSSDWDRMDVDQHVPSTVRATKGLKSKGSVISCSIPSPSLRLCLRDPPSPEKLSSTMPSSPQLIISFSDDRRSSPSHASPVGPDMSRYKRFLRTASSPSRSNNTHNAAIESSNPLMRLALTPESIRPLLGHAQKVRVHLNECIGEVRHIIGNPP